MTLIMTLIITLLAKIDAFNFSIIISELVIPASLNVL